MSIMTNIKTPHLINPRLFNHIIDKMTISANGSYDINLDI